jgi:predicted metal-dependent hydrolase
MNAAFKNISKTPEDLIITTREVKVDFESALRKNLKWHSDDIVISHFFAGLQATFPEGERFFIDAARDVRDSNKDKLPERLLEQIKTFIQQEAFHGQAHDAWCQALIALGFTRMKGFDDELRELRINAKENVPAMVRLSITSAVEHYTASLAHLFLRKREFIDGASAPFRHVLLYHALEEVEHKAVCYDLYNAAGGSYPLRLMGLFIASLDIAYQARKRHIYLLKKSGEWTIKNRLKAWKLIWGFDGIVINLLPYTLRYVKPSFHPWDSDERKALDQRYSEDFKDVGMSVFPQT